MFSASAGEGSFCLTVVRLTNWGPAGNQYYYSIETGLGSRCIVFRRVRHHWISAGFGESGVVCRPTASDGLFSWTNTVEIELADYSYFDGEKTSHTTSPSRIAHYPPRYEIPENRSVRNESTIENTLEISIKNLHLQPSRFQDLKNTFWSFGNCVIFRGVTGSSDKISRSGHFQEYATPS